MDCKIIRFCALILAISFFVGFMPSKVLAQSRQEIIEGAKKEGKLVVYWSFASELATKITDGFEKKYPFIKVTRFQTSVFKMIARYYQEILAKRPTCDMLCSSPLEPYMKMYQEGNLLQYDCPEWDNLAGYLPKEFIQRGYYGPFRVAPLGMMVNTKIVDPNTIKSYDDILQDRFKGQIAAGDVEHSSQAYPFYYALRKATGSTHYWKRLGELNAVVFVSSEKGSEACVAGEWPVIFDMWLYRGYQYGVQKGAPVKTIVPKEGVVVEPSPSGIVKQAMHPNAAKLMQDYMFSKEIQTLAAEMLGAHSARKDVFPPKGMPELKDIKILPIDYDEALRIKEQWTAEWKQLMKR